MVGAYDPNGKFTATTGRRFFTRTGADRERQRYLRLGPPLTITINGRPVPLTRFRVTLTEHASKPIPPAT